MDIIFIIKYIVLGIVEGLTEFLPVSSTGHLIIFSDFLNVQDDAFNKLFLVVCQFAAILAVVVLYWPRLWNVIVSFFKGDKKARRFVLVWIIACIPAVLFAVFFEDALDALLFNIPAIIISLAIGALLLLWGEKFVGLKNKRDDIDNLTIKDAIIIGIAQCVSLWPGFSRSASTIMGGWSAGLTTAAAADFSFFLAIPIMFGASAYSLAKYFFSDEVGVTASAFTSTQMTAFVLGCIVSFVVALVVVKAFLAFLKKKPLKYFSYYRLGLAIVLLVLLLTGLVTRV